MTQAFILAIVGGAQTSLFDPAAARPIETSIGYINGVLFGSIAVGLCVLAVAFVGALMLTGRVPVRRGFEVVTGCFVLLGASAIASGFMTV